MTPGIALLVVGGILLISGWKGGSIADAFMGDFPKQRSWDKVDPHDHMSGPAAHPDSERDSSTKGKLQLPRLFKSTHDTSGLPGYPAIDVFARPGTRVLAPADGVITKVSGQAGGPGGGGPYGYSLYLKTDSGASYFLTHFGRILVGVGDRIARGMPIGTVADYPDRADHIHQGLNQ